MPTTNFQGTRSVGVSWQWRRGEEGIKREARERERERRGKRGRSCAGVRGRHYHSIRVDSCFCEKSSRIPLNPWRGGSGVNTVGFFFVFFCHLLLPRHGPLSPLFHPELLDSRGGKWRFFLLFTCLPVAAWSHLTPDVHIHGCIVSTELWITFFSAGWWKAMCFSFWLQLIWPCPPTPPPLPAPSHQPFVRASLRGIVVQDWLGK